MKHMLKLYRGSILSPAVIPIGLTVSWSKLTKAGIFCGAIGGAFLGMLAWMIGCWKIYGLIFPNPTYLMLINFRPNQHHQPCTTVLGPM
jgi:Na+/proline symporter